MTRTGLFHYVFYDQLPAWTARGWIPVADLGSTHGCWTVLCWHCDCGQVNPWRNDAPSQ